MTNRSGTIVAEPPPAAFQADYQRLYVEGLLSLKAVAEDLSTRYGRQIHADRVRSWAASLGLPIRTRGTAVDGLTWEERRRQLQESRQRVTLADVARAEAVGALVRAPAREEAPLDVPFGSPEPSPEPGTFRFSELPAGACRWCVSPDHWTAKDFRFCGRPQQAGKPYCEEHQATAYRVPSAAEDNRLKNDFKRNAAR